MSKFQDAMRRVITGDNVEGQSVIIIDGGPSSEIGNADLGGLFEIWEDAAFGPLMPSTHEDLGTKRPVLGPRKGNNSVAWCDQAGLKLCTAHGLRKAGATIAANNGATAHQLMAIFGWATLRMARDSLHPRR